jgi:hypothetical protein
MTILKYLHVGGVIAMGFDPTGEYLLVISHSGRGVFSTKKWERIARDTELAYPEHGRGLGIGPINGISIEITEKNYDTEELHVTTPNGLLRLDYDSGTITISVIQE